MSPGDILILGIVAVSEAIAVLCAIPLWRGAEPRWKRALRTAALAVPLLGPLFFGALHRRVPSNRHVPGNPGFDLSRFDPTNFQPPAER